MLPFLFTKLAFKILSSLKNLVIAEVKLVLPWSTWPKIIFNDYWLCIPIVPTFKWGKSLLYLQNCLKFVNWNLKEDLKWKFIFENTFISKYIIYNK